MAVSLAQPTEVNQSARVRGGVLDVALPAPEGWERGLAIQFYGCGEPILRDKCITAIDVPARPTSAEFGIFPIEQGSTCSTVGKTDNSEHARRRLEQTSEWAVGRELQTGQASPGSPSLEDADVLGTVAGADFMTAVGCLEQAAADAGFGARWYLHAPVRAAAYLADKNLLVDGRSPTGAPWIISPGYEPQGPTTVRLWATGTVWAAVDDIFVADTPDFRTNSGLAMALRGGIVAFDPCLNIAVDVTVPGCPS
jgi:hypothetical protein